MAVTLTVATDNTGRVRVLADADVRSISPEAAVAAMREALERFADGRLLAPPRVRAGAGPVDYVFTVGGLAGDVSGRQAWAQLWALTAVRRVESVRVYSPRPEHRESFAARARDELRLPATAAGTAAEAVRGAGIVLVATRSAAPVIAADEVSPGAHVTTVGPKMRSGHEIPAGRARREAFVEAVLTAFPPFVFDLLAARAHARLWAALAAAGADVGAHERLVAATAIAAGWRVGTANIRHFERIPGLDVVVIDMTN